MFTMELVRVDFTKPMPLFPLADAVLLPHAILPLHVFEPRYRQMVETALDGSGQIAMASFRGDAWKLEYQGNPPLRPAVCIGQMVHHERLPDGRFDILLHGVCRACIDEMIEPDEEKLYRSARLTPLEHPSDTPAPLPGVRKQLAALLQGPRLSRMRSVDAIMQWFDRDDVPTPTLLELIGFALVHDHEVKYRLLAEPSATRRARLIRKELRHIDGLVEVAERQSHRDWPKGMSWN